MLRSSCTDAVKTTRKYPYQYAILIALECIQVEPDKSVVSRLSSLKYVNSNIIHY